METVTGKKPQVINVGVLGHVDSGKTSACAALSDVLSTAALDKNPQSKQRGITLDLQFSAIELRDQSGENVTFTLVDCPGHASLIRTIIGGSSIIDMVLMVVDVTKGIQTQTAEGFVLAEMTTDTVVILLNKVDLLPESSRAATIDRISTRLRKALEQTRFYPTLAIIPFAARPGGGMGIGTNADAIGVDAVKSWLLTHAPRPTRTKLLEPFLFAVDHCFSIKGKGTVATGTVLRGRIEASATVEVPHLKMEKKVKSIQMFKRPVDSAEQGDRVGLLIPGLEPSAMERGILCTPKSVSFPRRILVSMTPVRYFKQGVKSGAKFHITIGHSTVLSTISLLKRSGDVEHTLESEFVVPESENAELWRALVEFDHPTPVPSDSVYVASKLDTDLQANLCRLAFHGQVLRFVDTDDQLADLKAFKSKVKTGDVERIVDSRTAIGRNLFKKETDMNLFSNMRVTLLFLQPSDGELRVIKTADGIIEGAFGKSGKFKICCRAGEPFGQLASDIIIHVRLELKRYFWNLQSQQRKYVQ